MNRRIKHLLTLSVVMTLACSAPNNGQPPTLGTTSELNESSSTTTENKDPGQQQGAPSHEAAKSMPQVVLMPPSDEPVTVQVELARTPGERRHGLMDRKSMAPNQGMLFIFQKPAQLSFWMRNTYIPLDMIFIDPGMFILGIVENATPLTDDSRSVPGLSQYVLEVNGGFCRRHNVTKGSRVEFQGIIL